MRFMSRFIDKSDKQFSRPTESAECEKLVFDSRYRAKQYAKSHKWLGLTPYRCSTCDLWHMTSHDMSTKVHFRERDNPDPTVRVVGVFKEDGTPFDQGD